MNPAQCRILIVDDHPDNLRLFSSMLQQQNCHVHTAVTGTLGLEIARHVLPDVILLDIMLPDMDGYAVCARLKADAQTHDIPIIFISVYDAVGDKVIRHKLSLFRFCQIRTYFRTHGSFWRICGLLLPGCGSMEEIRDDRPLGDEGRTRTYEPKL